MTALLAPALFIPHGGGPLPLLRVPEEKDLAEYLSTNARKMLILDRALKAIIVVTAHWENSPEVMISSAKHHSLLFDYTFPQYPEAYKYTHNATGYPELAERIFESVRKHNLTPRFDPIRGWDHGVFVPMKLINPEADIPIIQISILRNHDAGSHWRIGEALREFRKEGVAILGSGMSYHNMHAFKDPPPADGVVNLPFDRYLDEVCQADEADERRELMLAWRNREGATAAHPPCEADHFMPFIVTAAAGGSSKCSRVFTTDYVDLYRLGAFAWI